MFRPLYFNLKVKAKNETLGLYPLVNVAFDFMKQRPFTANYSIESAERIRSRRQKQYCNRKFYEKREKFLLFLSRLAFLSSSVPPDLEIFSGCC